MSTAQMPHRPHQRAQQILDVFTKHFGDLIKSDPSAMETKFRKMAATPFAFYRGTACLFYHDLQHEQANGPYLDDRTQRVFIHGDLHAENFGSYMTSEGRLVFNVNDFDEAYVGPFTWDLKRFAAAVALIGYSKALSDSQIGELVASYATAYRERITLLATKPEDAKPYTLDTAKGPLLAALKDARVQSQVELLENITEVRDSERYFKVEHGVVELDDVTRQKVTDAFASYLKTLPGSQYKDRKVKDVVGRRGMGIGSAGLPTFNILVDGENEALESDIIVYMKQSQQSAVAGYVRDDEARAYFKHDGHRTVISQRALQAHADPWLGWTELDGAGQMVTGLSPYAVDFDWSDINDFEELRAVVGDLGRVTAMMHGVADNESEHAGLVQFSTEDAIHAAIAKNEEGFVSMLVGFAHMYGEQTRQDHRSFVDMFRNGRIPGLGN